MLSLMVFTGMWISIGVFSIPYPVNIVLGILWIILVIMGSLLPFYMKKKTEKAIAILTEHELQNDETTLATSTSRTDNTSMEMAFLPNINNLGYFKHNFGYEELEIATNGFSSDNFLGRGGFGFVHKGILQNGTEIAVKQLISDNRSNEREFIAEINALSFVHHRHLVQLIGYCITVDRRFLVFEYVPNGTLEYSLHGHGDTTIDWQTRLKISIGSAKGIAYLHDDCQPQIVHRDIKAANILLDNSFEAKVADFGLAKLLLDGNTHIYTSNIIGTRGYTPPEYHQIGEVRKEFDTYSFGVVLLELITGRKPIMTGNTLLADWARPLMRRALDEGNHNELVDPRLHSNYYLEEMTRMIACAFACLQPLSENRPLMSRVALVLGGHAHPTTVLGGHAHPTS